MIMLETGKYLNRHQLSGGKHENKLQQAMEASDWQGHESARPPARDGHQPRFYRQIGQRRKYNHGYFAEDMCGSRLQP